MEPEVLGGIIGAAGTILAACVVAVAGGLISRSYARERDRQDRESQWRQHAIELTKLELQRKIHAPADGVGRALRPSILDFLANYRDLQELGERSPAELYETVIERRIKAKPEHSEGT